MNKKRAKLMTTALRALRYRDEGMPDFVAAVPVVANWSMDTAPRAISADQVHRLLTSIDRTTSVGRRDYAILLLLAQLGLRLSEVAYLELDDIDWRSATLNVCTKGDMRNDFPLSHEVGEAIAHYLRHGRACSHSRRVFLRVRAPIGGFRSPGGVGSVIRHALERAGIDAPTRGAHQFRHGLATEMMRLGGLIGVVATALCWNRADTECFASSIMSSYSGTVPVVSQSTYRPRSRATGPGSQSRTGSASDCTGRGNRRSCRSLLGGRYSPVNSVSQNTYVCYSCRSPRPVTAVRCARRNAPERP